MAENRTPRVDSSGARRGWGVALIILGLFFLVDQVFRISLWSIAWPLGIVTIGLAFFVAMLAGGKSLSALAIPGSIVTTVGLIFLYQDAFRRFETWAYAWALIVVAVGLGLVIKGFWTDDAKDFHGGLRTMGVGAILFVVFGAFFELVVGFAGAEYSQASRWFWPVLLMAAGAFLLLRQGRKHEPR